MGLPGQGKTAPKTGIGYGSGALRHDTFPSPSQNILAI